MQKAFQIFASFHRIILYLLIINSVVNFLSMFHHPINADYLSFTMMRTDGGCKLTVKYINLLN